MGTPRSSVRWVLPSLLLPSSLTGDLLEHVGRVPQNTPVRIVRLNETLSSGTEVIRVPHYSSGRSVIAEHIMGSSRATGAAYPSRGDSSTGAAIYKPVRRQRHTCYIRVLRIQPSATGAYEKKVSKTQMCLRRHHTIMFRPPPAVVGNCSSFKLEILRTLQQCTYIADMAQSLFYIRTADVWESAEPVVMTSPLTCSSHQCACPP